MTIKSGQKGFLKDNTLKKVIEKNVLETSSWMVEASIYIKFVLDDLLFSGDEDAIAAEFLTNSSKKSFLPYFRQLVDWSKGRQGEATQKAKEKYSMCPAYAKIRKKYGLPLLDRIGKGNIFDFSAETFRSNFKNNIVGHAIFFLYASKC